MGYLDQFKDEYRQRRVRLALTDDGYQRKVVDLYPDAEVVADGLVHLAWMGTALYVAVTLSMTPEETAIKTMLSFSGMVVALFAGRLLPFSFALSGGTLVLGTPSCRGGPARHVRSPRLVEAFPVLVLAPLGETLVSRHGRAIPSRGDG
jgi:hypothetical protein